MRATWPLLGLSVLGCRPRVDLPDVPIIGGSEAQRESAREELLAFDDWVGPGRLQLTRVIFEDLEWPIAGHFSGVKDQLEIDLGVPDWDVRNKVRHELCHAIDYAEGLLDEVVSPFSEMGKTFDDPGIYAYRPTARGQRSEAFASTCMLGPLGTETLSSPCPEEAPLASELSSWVSERVWTEYSPEEPWPELGLPHATFTSDDPWASFTIGSTEEPAVLILAYTSIDGDHNSVNIDLHTGEIVGGSFRASPHIEPPGGVFGWGWPQGPGATLVDFPIEHIDAPFVERLFASDGQRWAKVADGCPDADALDWDVVAADGRVWYVWGDGTDIHWTNILPGSGDAPSAGL